MLKKAPKTERFFFLGDPAILLATWFGSGLLPFFPGTWGSLVALPFAWAVHVTFGWTGLIVAALILFVIGIWASNSYIAILGGDDPGPVVIDEVVGQWLTLVPAAYLAPAPDVFVYGVAFVLFRIADIFKPWPASWADRTMHGGLGIMLDDIFAAVYAAIALSSIVQYLGI